MDDHDLLVRIDEKLDHAIAAIADHEERIRPLESQQYQWLGRDGAVMVGLGIAGGSIISFFLWLVGVR